MQTKRIALSLLAVFLGGVPLAHTVRAASAGEVDTSFNANTDGSVSAVVVQSDGKILVGGSFAKVNGTAHANLARLNADGSLDAAFATTTDGGVAAMALQPDGKLLVCGTFTHLNGGSCQNIVRLNPDGSLDATYDQSSIYSYIDTGIYKLVYQSDGKSVIAGYGDGDYDYIERLNADGSLDTAFSPLEFSYTTYLSGPARVAAVRHRKAPAPPPPPQQIAIPVDAVAVQADGKVLYSTGPAINRANADGTDDTTFQSTDWKAYSDFSSILVQPDGQIVAGGPQAGTSPVTLGVVRMNAADGSPDASFQVVTCLGTISDLLYQPDGKLLVSGTFNSLDNLIWPNVARLNADGTPDLAFSSTPPAVDGNVSTMALQADGNVIIGGSFVRIGGVTHQGIARLYGAGTAVPTVTSADNAMGQVGVPFSYQITADNGPTAFAAGGVYSSDIGVSKPLPPGLSLDATTGIISGTPTREGDFVIAVQASNATGASVKEVPLTIATSTGQTHPAFFTGEEPLSNGVYYLKFFYSGTQPTNYFSYYS